MIKAFMKIRTKSKMACKIKIIELIEINLVDELIKTH